MEELYKQLAALARQHGARRLVLFGSRARGDNRYNSDIDLAVKDGNITGFTLDVKDTTSTLLDFDIVDLGKQIDEKLLLSIKKEGIVLYEKV